MTANTELTADDQPVTYVIASLGVYGFDEAPDEITALLGVEPSHTARRGDPYVNSQGKVTTRLNPRNGWYVDHHLDPHASLEEQVEDLVGAVKRAREKFQKLPPGSQVELRCSVFLFGEYPELRISAHASDVLGAIGAAIVVDIMS